MRVTVAQDRARRGERSEAARRGWETRRKHIQEVLSTVDELAEYARTTAEGLRVWYLNKDGAGDGRAGTHPIHAANRMDSLAERLSSTKRKENGA